MIRDRIPYETLVQGALRNVIRQVLGDVAAHGLPGEHHFYITFHTHIAGVEISSRLKERYPDHVTIVLQNQFWDLVVNEEGFSVTLSFSDIPERLVVPFNAIQAFYDPVASFEASFDIVAQIPDSVTEVATDVLQKDKEDKEDNPVAPMRVGVKKQQVEGKHKPDEDIKGAQVVSLDSFRKK